MLNKIGTVTIYTRSVAGRRSTVGVGRGDKQANLEKMMQDYSQSAWDEQVILDRANQLRAQAHADFWSAVGRFIVRTLSRGRAQAAADTARAKIVTAAVENAVATSAPRANDNEQEKLAA